MTEVVAWLAEKAGELAVDAIVAAGQAAGMSAPEIITAANIAFQVAYYGTEIGIYVGASELLLPKPPKAEAGKFNIRDTLGPRREGYGRCRLSGVFLLWEAKNNFYDVLYLCEGETDGVEQTYFNDDLVQIDAVTFEVQDTFLDHRYKSHGIWVLANMGLATEISFASLGINFDGEHYSDLGAAVWPTTSRADGCATLAVVGSPVELKDMPVAYPNGPPTTTQVRRCRRVFDWRDMSQSVSDPTTWKWSRNAVLCRAHYECFNPHGDQEDFATRIQPALAMWTEAANVCDEQVDVVFASSNFAQKSIKGATNLFLDDTTGLTVGATLFLNDPGETAVVASLGPGTGQVVITTGTSWPHNPGAPVAWEVTVGTVQEDRYALGGFFTYDNGPDDVQRAMLACCDGFTCEMGDGSLGIYAGKYYAPTLTIDDDLGHVVGFSWRRWTPDESAVNELIVSYTSPANQFSKVQCDPWTDDTDIALRGKMRSQPLDLDWVQNLSQARRLAKRVMARKAASLQGTVTCGLIGLHFMNQRYVGLNIASVSALTNIVVEITAPPKMDLMNGTVTFTWVLADPNIDAWNPATEEGASPVAPNSGAPNIATDPNIDSITPFYADNGTGGEGVRLRILIDDPLRTDITYSTRWRVSGDTSWVEQSYSGVTGDGTHVELDTGFVTANATIEVQVLFSAAGGQSNWAPEIPSTVSTSDSMVAPQPPTITSESGTAGGYTIDYRNPTSPNFNASRVHITVHGAGFGASTDASGARADAPGSNDTYTATGVTAGTYDLWVTAENAAATASAPTGPVTVTVT